jgi:murein DD-endopeptidase MepM/ murein hydrolase activator NlpD
VQERTPDKTIFAKARRGALLLGIAAGATASLCAAAHGQSGGMASPGGTVTPPPAVPPVGGPTQVFPIPTAHKYEDGFGAGRGHMGVDVFAPCGTPLIAVTASRVVYNGFQSSAGNYVVLRNKKLKRDYVYMHLQEPSPLLKKQKVATGQSVGLVGDTGNASGCHLHFELWKGKWYRGGRALDPMPSLLAWDAYS